MASTWTSTFRPREYPKLDRDIEADAVVIGGGIAGTTALYLLAKAGKRAVLIDKGSLSESATAYTTAFLTNVIDTGLGEMKEMFGEDIAAEVWRSHAEAIDAIEKIVSEEGIDCEFMRCGNYMFANDLKEWEGIVEEAELAQEYGFEAETKRDIDLPFKNRGSLLVKNQAKFHPLKYLDALRMRAIELGALIFEGTEATKVSCGEEETGCVATAGGNVWAGKIMVATYDPFNKPKELFAHKGIYTSYIMELSIPSGLLPEAIYEDEENPYHYFRVDRDRMGLRDRMLLGGEDHRHELPLDEEKAYAALEEYIQGIMPDLEYSIIAKWNGPIIETIDGLALIGPYSEKDTGAFVATGFSGNGMTYGTLAGRMFADFALGRESRFAHLYDPLRKPTASQLWQKGKDYAEELFRGYARDAFKATHKNDKEGEVDEKKRG